MYETNQVSVIWIRSGASDECGKVAINDISSCVQVASSVSSRYLVRLTIPIKAK